MRFTLTFALAFNLLLPSIARGQNGEIERARRLFQQKRWEAIINDFPDSPGLPAQIEYYRGMAFARLGRFEEARQAFIEGRKKDSRDERFPLELAGLAFKQKQFGQAKRELREALRLKPGDAYAKEFLATIYFLEGNLDAALLCWNQIGRPEVRQIRTDPPLRIDPGLLSRAFVFSPAAILRLKDLQATRARLNMLGVFSDYRFSLVPDASAGDTNAFDVKFSAVERPGWGDDKWEGLLASLRGLPYETIYPELYDIRGSGANLTSLIRWDDQKRRLNVTFSAPWRRNPKWRYEFHFDGRDENWNLSRTLNSAGPPLSDLNMRRAEAGAELESAENGRWSWTLGAAYTWRSFRNFSAPGQADEPAFNSGSSLEYRAATNLLLLDRPAKRFTLDSSLSAQLGKMFGHSPGTYQRLEAVLTATWFPRAQGDDYGISERLHLGDARGDLPMDELFILGLERDNNLPLRAHIGTLDGRKGNAPMGRRYFLSNWEIDKNIYSNGWVGLKIAPFLDTGRITDPGGPFGEREWLWDTGGEATIKVLGGFEVVLTYGKDLRTGRNTFYTSVGR